MRRGIRIVGWAVAGLLVLITAALVVLLFTGDSAIKTAVNRLGPSMLGVPVSVEQVELDPWKGHAQLKHLRVGNPPGFQTDRLFEVEDVTLDLKTMTLFAGTLHIRRIFIDKPQFTYERGDNGSNLDRMMEQMGGGKKPAKEGGGPSTNVPAETTGTPAGKKPSAGERKVIIDELIISNAAVRAHLPVVGELPPIAIGTIAVHDIGKREAGVPFSDAVKSIVRQVAGSIDQNVNAVAASLKQGAKQIEQQARPLIDALKGLFKKDKKKQGTD